MVRNYMSHKFVYITLNHGLTLYLKQLIIFSFLIKTSNFITAKSRQKIVKESLLLNKKHSTSAQLLWWSPKSKVWKATLYY